MERCPDYESVIKRRHNAAVLRDAPSDEQRAAIVAAARDRVQHHGAAHRCADWLDGIRCLLCDRFNL
jgi:hypothetical protein